MTSFAVNPLRTHGFAAEALDRYHHRNEHFAHPDRHIVQRSRLCRLTPFVLPFRLMKGQRILILAPHTDDGELGCGGTVNRLADANEVYYAAFSTCRQSVPEGFDPNVLRKEVTDATAILGIAKEKLILYDYEVRTFGYQRQRILDDMLHLKREISPNVVFMPAQNDVHQDHSTLTQEGIRAFKFSNLLCYELPWNNFSFVTSCFFALTEEHLSAKCEALAAYKSQAAKSYINEDFIKSLARVRGVQSGHRYAEAFEIIRWIV